MSNLKDSYDVVVIGAGMGGLTCGSLLAKKGLSVLVAEQHSKVGGCVGSFERKGFTFDTGVDAIAGCEEGGVILDTIKELGLEKEIELIKLEPPMRIIGSDYDITMISLETISEELKQIFPAESKNIDTFTEECRATAEEFAELAKAAPDLMSFREKMGFIIKFLRKCPRVRKYSGKSAREVLTGFFKEPRLMTICHCFLPFDPGAMAALMMMLLGSKEGHYYPKGGVQALVNLFAKGITNHGGDLALKTMVTRILVEDGKATGVELSDGTQVRARYVVSNSDGRLTFLKLVGEQHLGPKFVKELKETRLSGSNFLVSLGVDLDLRAMGFDGTTITLNRSNDLGELYGTDPEKCGISIQMHSLRDPSQAPGGMYTLGLIARFPYNFMDNWKIDKDGTRGKEYIELKEHVADKLITSVEKLIPGLSEHIVCKDIATPLTLERYTLNSQGAGGWFPAPGGKMRSQRSPIKNLYQAGQWTFPGGGVSTVVTSGRNAAQLVLKKAR